MLDATPVKTRPERKIPPTLNLPFPYNKQNFCRYEPIEKKIDHARVLIVNNLLRYESDLSDLARKDWGDEIENNRPPSLFVLQCAISRDSEHSRHFASMRPFSLSPRVKLNFLV